MASGIATGTMVWAAPLAKDVARAAGGSIVMSYFDNSANLNAYIAANKDQQTSTPYKLSDLQIAKIRKYTDGLATCVTVRHNISGFVASGHNGFCIFNELYTDCNISVNNAAGVPTWYNYYIDGLQRPFFNSILTNPIVNIKWEYAVQRT